MESSAPSRGARRALVIGANGFLGSHLTEALVNAGVEVRAFDRFSAEVRFDTDLPVEIQRGDFLNPADVERAVEGCDSVFHFASSSSPRTSIDNPILDLKYNAIPTVNLLDSCVKAGVQSVYFASSGGTIYGEGGGRAHSELSAVRPISPYGIGKATIENYLRYYSHEHGLRSISLRIGNPYGPRQRGIKAQGLIPIALRGILEQGRVYQYGDGQMVRDYLHVGDLASMITTVAQGATDYDVYNLGSGQGLSVRAVLALIREVVGRDFEVVRVPQPTAFVRHSVLDISRYCAEWGRPSFLSPARGIAETWSALACSR